MAAAVLVLPLLAAAAAAASLSPPAAANHTCPGFTILNQTGIRGQAFETDREISSVAGCCAACAMSNKCAAWVLQSTSLGSPPVCHLKPAATNPSGELKRYSCPLCPFAGVAPSPPAPPPPQCPPQQPKPHPPGPPPTLQPAGPMGRPHLFFFLQDDLGSDDVTFVNGNGVNADVTGNITAAAREGIILRRQYVHWHCSPTRRTFLTGRLPLHHSEFLSAVTTGDDIDLRWTTIGEKLKSAGYQTAWFGKGHTGYKSFNHLPLQLGFDRFTGFLGGAQDHFAIKRWEGNCPLTPANDTYSAELYGGLALQELQEYDSTAPGAKPLFFYCPWQNVHAPYQSPLGWTGDVLRGMLSATDAALGGVVSELKAKGMWANTVIAYSADNGGTDRGSNWPLRGSKHSNWEGGVRAAAFVSGGLIPNAMRGTESHVVMHIADWYSTFCFLAGVSHSDDPPVKPLAVDPNNPELDIYGTESWPSVDGVNIWPMLTTTSYGGPKNYTAAHTELWVAAEVMIAGQYKLVVSQQDANKTNSGPTLGWKCGGTTHPRCDTLTSAECGENPDTKGPKTPQCNMWVNATDAQCACGCYFNRGVISHPQVPCLFDVEADMSEFHDISGSAPPGLKEHLLHALKLQNLELYMHRADQRTNDSPSRSPAHLLGPCNANCSAEYWAKFMPGSQGPSCGVPGCPPEAPPPALP